MTENRTRYVAFKVEVKWQGCRKRLETVLALEHAAMKCRNAEPDPRLRDRLWWTEDGEERSADDL